MSSPASTIQDTAQTIRSMERDFARNANAQDARVLVDSYYAQDAQLQPPNTPAVRGRAAILDFWTAFMAPGVSGVTLETADVSSSGDLAYSTGRYRGTVGGQLLTGKYLIVYRRQADGAYKAVADAFGPDA